MAEELERDETAASELGATAAPAANRSRSKLDLMATAVGEVIIPGAKKVSSGLQASGQMPRRHSDGGDAVAAGTELAAGGSQTPKGSAPAIPEVASTPKGGTAMMAKSSIMRSFLNTGEKSTTKRTRRSGPPLLSWPTKPRRQLRYTGHQLSGRHNSGRSSSSRNKSREISRGKNIKPGKLSYTIR